MSGRVVVVTGAGRGIGQAAALALSSQGAHVVLADLAANNLAETQNLMHRRASHSTVVVSDVRSPSDIDAIAEAATAMGGADVLVNCAGIMRRAAASEATLDELDELWNVNVRGLYALTIKLLPQLIESRGKIINVGSLGSVLGLSERAAYAATKGAVRQYTQSLAVDLGPAGVCVNTIAPGYIETGMNHDFLCDPERRQQMLSRIPLGRFGTPPDLAGTFVFLASAASDYLTGQVVVVDGGWSSW